MAGRPGSSAGGARWAGPLVVAHLVVDTRMGSGLVDSVGVASRGVRTIKRHGGRVLVQDPATARADGMPAHAIADWMRRLRPAARPDPAGAGHPGHGPRRRRAAQRAHPGLGAALRVSPMSPRSPNHAAPGDLSRVRTVGCRVSQAPVRSGRGCALATVRHGAQPAHEREEHLVDQPQRHPVITPGLRRGHDQ